MINYVIYILFTIIGLVFMKLGKGEMLMSFDKTSFNFVIGYRVLLALIFYCTSFLLWVKIVGKNDISYIVPVTSAITNILVFAIGILIFKENFSLYKLLGAILAIAGVFLMNYK